MCLKKPSDLKVAPELPKYDGYEGILDTPIQSPAMHASLLATSAGKASLCFNYDVLCCFHLAWSYPRTFGINMSFSQKKITQIGNETIESLEPLEPSPTQTLQPLDQWPKAVEAPLTMTMAVPGPEKSEGSSQRMPWLGLGAWSSSNHSSLSSMFFFLSVESCFAIYSASDSYPIHRLARAALLPFFPAGLLPRLEWLAGRKWRPQENQWPKKDVQQNWQMPLDPMWIVLLIIPNWKVPYKRIILVLLLLSLLLSPLLLLLLLLLRIIINMTISKAPNGVLGASLPLPSPAFLVFDRWSWGLSK